MVNRKAENALRINCDPTAAREDATRRAQSYARQLYENLSEFAELPPRDRERSRAACLAVLQSLASLIPLEISKIASPPAVPKDMLEAFLESAQRSCGKRWLTDADTALVVGHLAAARWHFAAAAETRELARVKVRKGQ